MLSFIFIALIIAGAIGFFTRNRGNAGNAGNAGNTDVAGNAYGTPDTGPGAPRYEPAQVSTVQARADADHWVSLLGAGLTSLDGASSDDESRQRAARFALSDAAERHTAATGQLSRATSVHEIELASRTALEGLHYLRAARTALGLDPGPAVPASTSAGELTGSRRVVVQGTEYEASDQPGQRTPYYFPGGNVRGRSIPAGWYSTPWWKTALVAGAAGIGSLLVVDALFGHHGGFGHGGFGEHFAGGGTDHLGGDLLGGDWF